MRERSYEFRRRLNHVHQSNRRDPSRKPEPGEVVVENDWAIEIGSGAGDVVTQVAKDLQDYFFTSMNVSTLLVRRTAAPLSEAPPRTIRLMVKDELPEAGEPLSAGRSYRIVCGGNSVVVCGNDERGIGQGCYYLEDVMNLREAPYLEAMDIVREPVFSPRMTHSGWGIDQFPDPRPSPGWWPCTDYPQWLDLLKGIMRRHNPDLDIVFWTYNWGYAPEADRLALIRALPTDVSLMATFEMFEEVEKNGIPIRCVDYTVSFAGPGAYFRSEARAAHERGLRLYTMSNTGGLTWDFGTIPYQPVPLQWARRHDGLLDANQRWGLCGLMECHHFGWWPSFVSDLAKWAYWSPRVPAEIELLERMKARWEQGIDCLKQATDLAPGRKRGDAQRMLCLGRFIRNCLVTAIHTKQWWQLTERLKKTSGSQARASVVGELLRLGEAEIRNAEATIPLVDADSRLGWEPSMEYMTDREHLEWKIDQLRKVLDEEIAT